MTDIRPKRCATCLHWDADELTDRVYQEGQRERNRLCRRLPPTAGEPHTVHEVGRGTFYGISDPIWPTVAESDWCGEWKGLGIDGWPA